MSDNWIQFVPADPLYRPYRVAAERARSLLASFAPHADEVNATFTDSIEFFDPGGNLSEINCPACGANVQEWWTEAMDSAYSRGFSDLQITTRCCGARVSLNDLVYDWPAAFDSFVVEAMNPGIFGLTPEQERRLAECLGCKLTRIWCHL